MSGLPLSTHTSTHHTAAIYRNTQATVAVIQDLQQQVQAAASPTPSSPSSSTATKGRRVPASPVCNSPTRSSRQTTPPHHSAGQTTAARSALFTKGASERAVAQWQQHKLQQEQEVSKSLTAQLDKECLLLGQLQADEAAACTAHKQVRVERLLGRLMSCIVLGGGCFCWTQHLRRSYIATVCR